MHLSDVLRQDWTCSLLARQPRCLPHGFASLCHCGHESRGGSMASDSHRSQRNRADDGRVPAFDGSGRKGGSSPLGRGQLFVRSWRSFNSLRLRILCELVRAAMIGWSENGGNQHSGTTAIHARCRQHIPSDRTRGRVGHDPPPILWRSLSNTACAPLDPMDSDDSDWCCCSHQYLAVSSSLLMVVFILFQRFQRSLADGPSRHTLLYCRCVLVLPGFITTITEAFGAGTDPSISTRVDDYPRVEGLVAAHPWTGIGPGAYVFPNAVEILDNQYLERRQLWAGSASLVSSCLSDCRCSAVSRWRF